MSRLVSLKEFRFVRYGIRATIIVGGDGNSGGQAAVVLSEMASHVHLIVRGGSPTATMSRYVISRIELFAQIPR